MEYCTYDVIPVKSVLLDLSLWLPVNASNHSTTSSLLWYTFFFSWYTTSRVSKQIIREKKERKMKSTVSSLLVKSLSCKRITRRIFSCFPMWPRTNFCTIGRFQTLQIVDLVGPLERRPPRNKLTAAEKIIKLMEKIWSRISHFLRLQRLEAMGRVSTVIK